jgi:hypothetical protein
MKVSQASLMQGKRFVHPILTILRIESPNNRLILGIANIKEACVECAWVTSFIQGLYKVLFIYCLQVNVHGITHSCPLGLLKNIYPDCPTRLPTKE